MIQPYSSSYSLIRRTQNVRFQGATPKPLSAKEVVDKWSQLQPEELKDFDREYDRAVTKNKINTSMCDALKQANPQDVIDALTAKLDSTPGTTILSPRIYTIAIASMQNTEQALALIDAFAQRGEKQAKAEPRSIRPHYPFTSHRDAAAGDLRNHAYLDKQHYFPAGFDHSQIMGAIDILDDVIKDHL